MSHSVSFIHRLSIGIFLISTLGLSSSIQAQDGDPNWAEMATLQVENMILSENFDPLDQLIKDYVDTSIKSSSEWKEQLLEIRNEMHDLDGDVGLSADDKGLILSMSNRDRQRDLRIVLNHEKQKISKLETLDPPATMNLTWNNLSETFDQLEEDGMSGIIYIKKKENVVIQHPFGMSDRKAKKKNKLGTIFGTGSRPIDYTVAAIQLLDQKAKLNLNDPISKYISNVPDDKLTMTISHLMTGRSGLPDFFDNDSDWDADLAWVNRDDAVKRMMNQKLLFAPGEGQSHSHGAFGLIAAIIEIVSGEAYYEFIRKHLLDPAGMKNTGEYGQRGDQNMEDFAVGSGPQKIGFPNIPPNWGLHLGLSKAAVECILHSQIC
ncbi:MAG: serine hydrolase [Saprospiraceae bacterium]|nr:serine hydrolase [Saprospiraceae bacterium]